MVLMVVMMVWGTYSLHHDHGLSEVFDVSVGLVVDGGINTINTMSTCPASMAFMPKKVPDTFFAARASISR
jgi:hypothetical protein